MKVSDFRPKFDSWSPSSYNTDTWYKKETVDAWLDEFFDDPFLVGGTTGINIPAFECPDGSQSHVGIVCGIRPIAKKECEHEAVGVYGDYYRCRYCDVKMKPVKWEVADRAEEKKG